MTEDIEMREAQLVFVELEKQWNDEENRSFGLMRELEAAENRVMAAFMDEWRDRAALLPRETCPPPRPRVKSSSSQPSR